MNIEDLEKWCDPRPHDDRVWVGNGISLAEVKNAVRELLDRRGKSEQHCPGCVESLP